MEMNETIQVSAEIRSRVRVSARDSPLLRDFSPGLQACFAKRLNSSAILTRKGVDVSALCPVVWDSIVCWPYSRPNTTAILPCMRELNGVVYDTRNNVTRFCQANGTWESKSNYSMCSPIIASIEEIVGGSSENITPDVTTAENVATLYLLGYAASVVALSIGLYIFTRLKDLRCVRNTIHTHLMLTYMLVDVCWLLGSFFQMVLPEPRGGIPCFLIVAYHFLHVANFSWMFVEGLYLYLLVVKTFYVEKIKVRLYMLVGWGKSAVYEASPYHTRMVTAPRDCVVGYTEVSLRAIKKGPGEKATFDSYSAGPAVVATDSESPPFASRLDAVTGITPRASAGRGHQRTSSNIYSVLESPYSLNTVIYCFLNSEVQESISNHVERWKSTRDVPVGSQCSYATKNIGNIDHCNPKTSVRLLENNTVGEAVPMHCMNLASNLGLDSPESGAHCSISVGSPKPENYIPLLVFPPLFPAIPCSSVPDMIKSQAHGSSPSMLSNPNSSGASTLPKLTDGENTPSATTSCLPASTSTSTTHTPSPPRVSRMLRQFTISNTQDIQEARKEILATS
ncbi:diuretic hormone receptor-like [Macrobrachium rosenbergii]|uniref:diuretic hormone receptor-like n=1 Tax=Macrobrachium rosenbergii TaxID=79674 RepID=UPI0034D6CB1B